MLFAAKKHSLGLTLGASSSFKHSLQDPGEAENCCSQASAGRCNLFHQNDRTHGWQYQHAHAAGSDLRIKM